MSQTLVLNVSDETYSIIQQQAEAASLSPSQLAVILLEQRLNFNWARSEADKLASRKRFESHFGEIAISYPAGADNESIDADIAREYANNH